MVSVTLVSLIVVFGVLLLMEVALPPLRQAARRRRER